VLLEGGGRQAVDLGRLEVVANVERADVLDALAAAVLQKGEKRAERELRYPRLPDGARSIRDDRCYALHLPDVRLIS
jgi:hypothetical protein